MNCRIPIIATTAAIAMVSGLNFPARAEVCQAYTVDRPADPYGYAEINNCSLISGEFANRDWQVTIGAWEPAAYLYRGVNRYTGASIQLIDFDVAGTTERPQYRFHNGDTTYVVSFQSADPNTIRLQVYQLGQPLLNEVLYR
ncbi:hypothetical protein IQ260_13750 [Leptolyngbya cf. ectocarpi LEGE 11479]|uniref:Secreted protein n=1 Tax=Leptolyngbya cf. ectocarpi LEGE 11479 TaxID=1828722 RepID=A0A929F9R9_LEPEC|nr:hypothetical protein [Leptolyngbya ectocarpi]MBE9067719.1 hypothetical protein [Leptolyngbya cf. ectocarpi LEGE 11479]